MTNTPFVPKNAGKPFVYEEARFAKISKDDDACYRCHRTIISIKSFWPLRSPETVPTGLPFDNPQTDQEKAENQQWCADNMGRNSEEAFRWSHTGGYHSNNLDCIYMCLVLCEDCKLEILGPYMKFKDHTVSPHMHHYSRHRARNDQNVQSRWDARKQKRALRDVLTGLPICSEGKKKRV